MGFRGGPSRVGGGQKAFTPLRRERQTAGCPVMAQNTATSMIAQSVRRVTCLTPHIVGLHETVSQRGIQGLYDANKNHINKYDVNEALVTVMKQ